MEASSLLSGSGECFCCYDYRYILCCLIACACLISIRYCMLWHLLLISVYLYLLQFLFKQHESDCSWADFLLAICSPVAKTRWIYILLTWLEASFGIYDAFRASVKRSPPGWYGMNQKPLYILNARNRRDQFSIWIAQNDSKHAARSKHLDFVMLQT